MVETDDPGIEVVVDGGDIENFAVPDPKRSALMSESIAFAQPRMVKR